jgi:hypothetical protein
MQTGWNTTDVIGALREYTSRSLQRWTNEREMIPSAQRVGEALLSEAMKSLSVLGHKKHALY